MNEGPASFSVQQHPLDLIIPTVKEGLNMLEINGGTFFQITTSSKNL